MVAHSLSVFNSTLMISAQVKRKCSLPLCLVPQAVHHDRDCLISGCTGSPESYELHRGWTLPPASPASYICTRRLTSQGVKICSLWPVLGSWEIWWEFHHLSLPLFITERQFHSLQSCKTSRGTWVRSPSNHRKLWQSSVCLMTPPLGRWKQTDLGTPCTDAVD
jgi:hypothetical protein